MRRQNIAPAEQGDHLHGLRLHRIAAFIRVLSPIVVQSVAEGLQEPPRAQRARVPGARGRFGDAPQVHDAIRFQCSFTGHFGQASDTESQAAKNLHSEVFALGLGDGVGGRLLRVGVDVRNTEHIAIDGRLRRKGRCRLRRGLAKRCRGLFDQRGDGGERAWAVARRRTPGGHRSTRRARDRLHCRNRPAAPPAIRSASPVRARWLRSRRLARSLPDTRPTAAGCRAGAASLARPASPRNRSPARSSPPRPRQSAAPCRPDRPVRTHCETDRVR